MITPSKRPEAKAIAAPVGGGLGGVLTVFTLWLIGVYVWDAPSDAAHATLAIAAVPLPVSGLITAVVPAAFALAAAYWAPHTHRPDLAAEVPATHLDERIATHLEQVDATLTDIRDDLQHTAPIKPVPSPDMGLRIMDGPERPGLDRIMDEAHD